jgi:hypothetical protein
MCVGINHIVSVWVERVDNNSGMELIFIAEPCNAVLFIWLRTFVNCVTEVPITSISGLLHMPELQLE